MLLAGLSPLSAVITSYMVVLAGHSAALITSHKDIRALPKNNLRLLIPCIAGSVIGILALNSTSNETFNVIVPWLLLFTVAIFIFQPYLQLHVHRPAHMRPRVSAAIVFTAIFIASIYAGFFGLGAGLLLLTLFGFTRIKNIYQMIGLKNLAGFLIVLLATIVFAASGKIIWEYGLILAAGSIIGGYTGAKFAHCISPQIVRIMVGIIGIVVVIAAFLKF